MNEFLHRLLFLPDQASTFAPKVDTLHYFVIVTTLIMSTAVGLTALLLFVRYRRRSEDQTTPPVKPRLWIEVLFIAVPLAFFLLWFGIGYRDFVWAMTPPKDAMDVFVMGKQWMWKFSYPDGPNAIGVLRVPAHRPVRLLLTSRDVIHSFFVPDFRIKMDVIPGRYSQTWFEATRTGRFQVLCAEYCGLSHSTMWAEVEVLEPDEFDRWLESTKRGTVRRQDLPPLTLDPTAPATGLADEGHAVAVRHGCLKCHSVDGSAHIGPTWRGLFYRDTPIEGGARVTADPGYLSESMMDPQTKVVMGFKPVMPSFQGRLGETEVAALIEYIRHLSSGPNAELSPTEATP